MLPIHTILHPTDFSARAKSAFDFACASRETMTRNWSWSMSSRHR